MFWKYSFLSVLFVSFFIPHVFGSIKINEIAIDQTPQAIELINTASESADISEWYLDDNGGTTYYSIPQNTMIYSNSCIVFLHDFNLNKSSDMVRLFNNYAPPTASGSVLIDSYSYKSSPGINKSYVRLPDGNDSWTTSDQSLGLLNSSLLSCIITPSVTPSPTITLNPTLETPTQTITPSSITTQNSPQNNIYISEVMVYPNTGEHEWVEFYNMNDHVAVLTDWYIDDVENGGTSPRKFSLEIQPYSYSVYELSSSLFNNDADSIRLLDSKMQQKDGFEYNHVEQNKTLGRINWDSDLLCKQEPSCGVQNNICTSPSLSPTLTDISKTLSIHPSILPTNEQKSQQFINYPPQEILIPYHLPNEQNILGLQTHNSSSQISTTKYYIQLYLVLSFIYSFLTIALVLVKIKHASLS